jgi:CRP/FNR family transcriptional regulator, nitrogen fixation regulation protein
MLSMTAARHATPSRTTRGDTAVPAVFPGFSQISAVSFYNEDSVIYAQGEKTGPLYLVEFGAVRTYRLTADGRRQISAFYFAGEVFGFEAGDEHHFYAESIDRSGIRVLRPTHGERHADTVLPLALNSLIRAQEHLLVLGRQSAVERVAAFLLDLAERQDSETHVDLPMSRADIADYLGLTFETVSRVLRRLKDSKLIRLAATRQVELLNPDGMAELCE